MLDRLPFDGDFEMLKKREGGGPEDPKQDGGGDENKRRHCFSFAGNVGSDVDERLQVRE